MADVLTNTNQRKEDQTMFKGTFQPEVIYEVENDELGVLAQVSTSSNIMWKFKVTVHDVDECEIVGTKSFKTKIEAEAYADRCIIG